MGWTLLKLAGWQVVTTSPIPRKAVIVFSPHTSNWDFLIGLAAKWALRIHVRWVGKDSMFRTPLAAWFRRLGGIPVNRREHTGFVAQMAHAMAAEDEFRLVIAPEGTRSRTERWHAGFYHVARAAGVPLGLAFIDYATREIGIAGFIDLTGDVARDMARIAAFYEGRTARRPQNAGPVRLDEGPVVAAERARASAQRDAVR